MPLREIKDYQKCLHCPKWKRWIGTADPPKVDCYTECEGYGQQTLDGSPHKNLRERE